MAQKADVEQQAAWKKAFGEALRAEGLKLRDVVVFADEMRIGLMGQVRRRWGVRGVKMRHRVELRYEWRCLVPMTGRLWWAWPKRVRGKEVAQVVERWGESGVKGVVWDNAAFYRARALEGTGIRRIYQPPYSPEVNPMERRFAGSLRGNGGGVLRRSRRRWRRLWGGYRQKGGVSVGWDGPT